ncbi:thioredoxin family protein [Bizionia sediminis]|uniref:Thioredoxin family protein n=1 Tax=Bizionia sediminis TaxID=1737064 RepID=A0ABW5KSU6_9FLAO
MISKQLVAFCLFFTTFFALTPLQAQTKVAQGTDCTGDCHLVGKFDRRVLESNETYASWFLKNYNDYQIDATILDTLQALSKNNITFKIIMGTWCSDSQRDVPRFSKILDTLQISSEAITYYALDTNKQSAEKIEETYNVRFVPTFIILENGVERNRIVEMSIQTLEADLLNILTSNTYKHVYAE